MPELLRKQVLGPSSRVRSLACAIALAVLPAIVHAADPLPASVRACAAITDVLQRLSCYDREVARYPVPQAKSAPTGAPAADSSKHFVAHVVSIDHQPNEMILHLDNGQVWQEVQSVSGDLSLREGDAVTIDRHFGSYWLSGPHVSSMKVRQKS